MTDFRDIREFRDLGDFGFRDLGFRAEGFRAGVFEITEHPTFQSRSQ